MSEQPRLPGLARGPASGAAAAHDGRAASATGPLAVFHRTTGAAQVGRAAAAGAAAYEMDVRLIGDQVRVGHWSRLAWLPSFEHDDLRLRRASTADGDPTAAEVVAALPPGAAVVLDLKDDRGDAGARLVDRLASCVALPEGRTYVTGHTWADLAHAQATAGWTPLYTVASPRQLLHLRRALPQGHYGLTVRQRLLTAATVPRLLGLTDLLLAWTVQDVARAAALLALGVTGIVTDSLDVLQRVRAG